jgi:predicted glutamine amidotransferase
MCIAALIKPGANITDVTMHKMANANRNGLGIGFLREYERGKGVEVCTDKGLFNSDEWVTRFRAIQKAVGHKSPIILHARIATLGRVSQDNCHPFKIKDGLLAHNGSMWYTASGRTAIKSDTRELAERMHNNFVYEDIMQDKKRVENSLGHNKLILLFNDYRYIILNEELGSWTDDVWFSNPHWKNASTTCAAVSTN